MNVINQLQFNLKKKKILMKIIIIGDRINAMIIKITNV